MSLLLAVCVYVCVHLNAYYGAISCHMLQDQQNLLPLPDVICGTCGFCVRIDLLIMCFLAIFYTGYCTRVMLVLVVLVLCLSWLLLV